MNELKQLESLGLLLPTPAYTLGAILIGITGWIAFRCAWSGLHFRLGFMPNGADAMQLSPIKKSRARKEPYPF